MQSIIEHTLGVTSLNDLELRKLADSIHKRQLTSSGEHDIHVEASLATFSRQLEQKLGKAEQDDETVNGTDVTSSASSAVDAIAEFCRSPSPVAEPKNRFFDSILASMPPRVVAELLVSICFEKVQCNSFYAEEKWVLSRLDMLYGEGPSLSERDTPVIASLLMILALGSQFSMDPAFESLGHALYEKVTSVILAMADQCDFESVRACLLLSTYLFPIDHSGKAYTYLGLTLHILNLRMVFPTLTIRWP